jgi:hypothetical protein
LSPPRALDFAGIHALVIREPLQENSSKTSAWYEAQLQKCALRVLFDGSNIAREYHMACFHVQGFKSFTMATAPHAKRRPRRTRLPTSRWLTTDTWESSKTFSQPQSIALDLLFSLQMARTCSINSRTSSKHNTSISDFGK